MIYISFFIKKHLVVVGCYILSFNEKVHFINLAFLILSVMFLEKWVAIFYRRHLNRILVDKLFFFLESLYSSYSVNFLMVLLSEYCWYYLSFKGNGSFIRLHCRNRSKPDGRGLQHPLSALTLPPTEPCCPSALCGRHCQPICRLRCCFHMNIF